MGAETPRDLEEVLPATRDRVGLPFLRLREEAADEIEFIGPKETKRPRFIKLDITGDELVIDDDNRSAILTRYEDQPDAPSLRVYSLAETTVEKLRAMMQRLQCRDLYDAWYLLEHAPSTQARSKPTLRLGHATEVSTQVTSRRDTRNDSPSTAKGGPKKLSQYMAHPPDVDRIIRETTRQLRRAGYLQSGE